MVLSKSTIYILGILIVVASLSTYAYYVGSHETLDNTMKEVWGSQVATRYKATPIYRFGFKKTQEELDRYIEIERRRMENKD